MSNPQLTLRAIAQSRVAPDTEMDAQGIVEIVGPDLDEILRFYEALGFCVERKTGPFAVLNGFGMRIFLAENPDAVTDKRWTNIRIVVPNVNLVWECVNGIGLPIVHTITSQPYGLRDFVVGDPSGFEIRFAQVL